MLNESYVQHFTNGTEDNEHKSNGVTDWQRAVPTTSTKGALTQFSNTRRTGGDGTTYPVFTPKQVMPSAKVYGKTEKTIVIDGKRYIVPNDIELVDYIESTGTQYIDTGISNVKNSRFEIDAQVLDLTGSFPTILGSYLNSKFKIVLGFGSSSKFYTQCGPGSSSYTYGPTQDTDRHKFIVENTTDSVKITVDTTVNTGSYTINDDDGSNLYLFARHIADGVANYSRIKAYSVKIWNGNTLARAMYPAIKNNVVGMYDFITGTFFTNAGTGTFTAGKKTKTVRTVNLFDIDNTTPAYLNEEGVAVNNSAFACSDFIEIKPNTSYTFSGETTLAVLSNGQRICFYDSLKTFISPRGGGAYTSKGKWSFTETSPDNAKYIRVSCGYSVDIQLEEGSVASPYIPYTLEVPITELYGTGDKTKNLFDKTADSTDKYFNNSGAEEALTIQGVNFVHSELIPVKPNTTYVIIGHSNLNTSGYFYKKTFWSSNKQFLSYMNQNAILTGNYSFTVTTPANCYYLAFNHWATDDSVMLTEGSTAPTEYIPYGYQVDTLLGSQGCVDLGTLAWSLTEKDGHYRFYSNDIRSLLKIPSSGSDIPSIYLGGHTSVSWTAIYGTPADKEISITINPPYSNHGAINVVDDRYRTPAEFKSAMSGKYLYYQRSTDATWQPPVKHTFYTDRQLNAVSTFEDILTSNNDGTGIITGNVGVKVLDGTEDWSYNSTIVAGHSTFTISIDDSSNDNAFIPISSNYIGRQATTSFAQLENGQFKHGSSSRTYYFVDDRFTSVNDFKAYLASEYANGTPVTIIYPLATPTTTQLTNLPIISLGTKGTHTLENTNTVKGNTQATVLGKEGN